MDYLNRLENKSIHIIREAYQAFPDLCVLWSMGKDSTVLLWLIRKAFFGDLPFPIVHIDTSYKIREMIEFRDKLAKSWHMDMWISQNVQTIAKGETFPMGNSSRLDCCNMLKTETLKSFLNGTGTRFKLNHLTGEYEENASENPFTAVMLGIRADEEGSRSKERYFSPRGVNSDWVLEDQPPEFWNHYTTEHDKGIHVRIHPLLDWTEINVWEYILRERIPVPSLYFDQGNGLRYRSLGCKPCTQPICSKAKSVEDIIWELREGPLHHVPERLGRKQDEEDRGGLQTLRKKGYM